jgi:hypothetical protein
MTRILRHLQLASVPPPIAPARIRQEIFAFDEAHASVSPEARCTPQRRHSPLFAWQFRLQSSPLIVFKPAVPRLWRGETPETLP